MSFPVQDPKNIREAIEQTERYQAYLKEHKRLKQKDKKEKTK